MRDRYLYKTWITMSQTERSKLYQEAINGDDASRRLFFKMSTSLRMEANARIRSLRNAHFDYGKAYNNLEYYLEIEHSMTRVPTMTEVGKDIDELMTINEQVRKFLKSKYSDVSYRRYEAKRRIEHIESVYEEKGVEIFKDWTTREKMGFLRWLDNEQVSYIVDEYGTSDETIEILADAWKKNSKTTTGMRALNGALAEFAAGDISFVEAMDKVGVNIGDTHKQFYRRWMGELNSQKGGHYER